VTSGSKPDFKVMALLLVFMQLTRDLFAIAKFLLLFAPRVTLNVLRFRNEQASLCYFYFVFIIVIKKITDPKK